MGVIRAAADLAISIPKELSVVGYDDIPMSQFMVPRLTTVSKDPVVTGQKAMKLLLARIKNRNRPIEKIEMPTRVLVRESTGPAPGEA